MIDGVDISHIPRSTLRRQCFITIPQDTFIVADASLRFNLDPENVLTAEALVAVLEITQIWTHFCHGNDESDSDFAEKILDLEMSSLPPLSTGQLQLLALARALAQLQYPSRSDSPILILDEATASLDLETESIMQDVIQQEFTNRGHTVICIAHRVSNLAQGLRPGLDAVAWMKDGHLERVSYDVDEILMKERSRSPSSDAVSEN